MQLPRFVGLVDLGVATIIVVALVLPARERQASSAIAGDEPTRFALALAEARVDVRPGDGLAVEDYGRRLGRAGFKDWAVDATVQASTRAPGSPTRWRTLLAASVAYVDRLDVKPALKYAQDAVDACKAVHDTCPDWEEIKVDMYERHLAAGVNSGIDPRKNAKAFRDAANNAGIRQVQIKSTPRNEPAGSNK
jgi:hypothetical protein